MTIFGLRLNFGNGFHKFYGVLSVMAETNVLCMVCFRARVYRIIFERNFAKTIHDTKKVENC